MFEGNPLHTLDLTPLLKRLVGRQGVSMVVLRVGRAWRCDLRSEGIYGDLAFEGMEEVTIAEAIRGSLETTINILENSHGPSNTQLGQIS